jgi:hypothetical protein
VANPTLLNTKIANDSSAEGAEVEAITAAAEAGFQQW